MSRDSSHKKQIECYVSQIKQGFGNDTDADRPVLNVTCVLGVLSSAISISHCAIHPRIFDSDYNDWWVDESMQWLHEMFMNHNKQNYTFKTINKQVDYFAKKTKKLWSKNTSNL